MRKYFPALAALLTAGLALAAAASSGCARTMEEQLRRSLAALTSTGGEATRSRVQEIAFSPFSRQVLARGLEVRTLSPQGPVTCHIAEISLRLPLRALLACTPLRHAILPKSGMLFVAEDIVLRNVRAQTPRSRITVQREEISKISAESALVSALLEGQAPEPFSIFSRIRLEKARASFIQVDIPTVSQPQQMSAKEAFARNWQGRRLEEFTIADLQWKVDGQEALRLQEFSLRGILLPDKALMRHFAEQAALPLPNKKALQILVGEMFAAEDPVFRDARLTGLSLPVQAGPAALKELSLDAEIRIVKQGKDTILEQSVIKAADLGNVRYSLLTSGNTLGMNIRQALANQRYSDLKLHFEDRGLMARLALAAASRGTAVSAFKAGIADVCALNTPENKALAAALEQFVNRPGALEITTLPGKSYRLKEVLDALIAGDPGRGVAHCGATRRDNTGTADGAHQQRVETVAVTFRNMPTPLLTHA